MNVSNTAYYKPLTTVVPSLQREGFDPSTEIDDPWYAPIEKVTPRKYHKYAQTSLKEKLYGPEEEEEPGDEGEGKDDPVDPQNPDQPVEPENPVEPEQPDDPVDPQNPDQPEEPVEPENP